MKNCFDRFGCNFPNEGHWWCFLPKTDVLQTDRQAFESGSGIWRHWFTAFMAAEENESRFPRTLVLDVTCSPSRMPHYITHMHTIAEPRMANGQRKA